MSGNVEPFKMKLDSIIERSLGAKQSELNIYGISSPLVLAHLLCGQLSPNLTTKTHIVMLPTDLDCDHFETALHFFNPGFSAYRLESYDVSPYSLLYPNGARVSKRLGWLGRALNAKPMDVFFGSLADFSQKTIPMDAFIEASFDLSVGLDLPVDWQKKLLNAGYQQVPRVEDPGQFSVRGGIFDLFPGSLDHPVRIELFGERVEMIKTFDPETQRTLASVSHVFVVPAKEVLYDDETRERAARHLKLDCQKRDVQDLQISRYLQDLSLGRFFHGVDFLLADFYERPVSCLSYFNRPSIFWNYDSIELLRQSDIHSKNVQYEYDSAQKQIICPHPSDLFLEFDEVKRGPPETTAINVSQVKIENDIADDDRCVLYHSKNLNLRASLPNSATLREVVTLVAEKIQTWRSSSQRVFISTQSENQAQRLSVLLENHGLNPVITKSDECAWADWINQQDVNPSLVHLLPRSLNVSLFLPEEDIVFLREHDFFGPKSQNKTKHSKDHLARESIPVFQFSDFNIGDLIVHVEHGVGIYEGLKLMPVQGVDTEFIQIRYRDNDRLYLPVYRVAQIQKFSGSASIDKLGGNSWKKTKIKVQNHLRDIASNLLDLYAKRSQVQRPPFSEPNNDYRTFESGFPYVETPDQLKAIETVLDDMLREQPMDRLVCGDVGFGKTEVALRAAFKAVQDGRQVAVLVPTTVLAFQHLETFRSRFKNWPFTIRDLSRFTSKKDIGETLSGVRSGSVDIVIGTHRLLSKDIHFKNLGLLVVDEEQKFGVVHKERIKNLKVSVDTLTLSATPIPRTLNMSLVGIRDLSIINSAPVDRLPIRTFITKFNDEMIRKAVMSEIHRGGQIFFIHNRVQSIYEMQARIREIVPEARIVVGHGQMEENSLERTMLSFYKHEYDILLCTTIIESGLDIPRANTMIVDRADTFGLSQLYQLRGRVGRGKERAYCYLLIPPSGILDPTAQERLKTLQEHSALGSGFKIAHFDLELRGAGNILGETQSGHIDAIGYELYLELLEETLQDIRGVDKHMDNVEPEINLRIAAFIPDQYIPDIRTRLSYYKALTNIRGPEDVDKIEEDLRDQFGKLPDQVINLLGVMLIRRNCKELGVRDISAGTKTVSLAFTDQTRLPTQKVIELTAASNKKYTLTPDSRLIVRMNSISWPAVHDELEYLKKLIP